MSSKQAELRKKLNDFAERKYQSRMAKQSKVNNYDFPEHERGVFWDERSGRKVKNNRNDEIESLFDSLDCGDNFDLLYEGTSFISTDEVIAFVEAYPNYFERKKAFEEYSRKVDSGVIGLKHEVQKKAKEMERNPQNNYVFSCHDFESFIYTRLKKAYDNRMNALREGRTPPTRYFVQTLNNAYKWAEHDVYREIGGFERRRNSEGKFYKRITDTEKFDGYELHSNSSSLEYFYDVGVEQEFESSETSLMSVLIANGKAKPIDREVLTAVLGSMNGFNLSDVARKLGITRQEARSSMARLKKVFEIELF